MNSMTVYSLMSEYKANHPDGHFFDHDTLKFFGERISEMRVLKGTTCVKDYLGEEHECYCLSSLQRKNPLGPRRKYSYFEVGTFDIVYRG